MDTTLIDKLARLRGIGDAYHDYRGELRFFSTHTKASLLRAMGSPVDDPATLAAEVRRLEAARWKDLLPQVVTSRLGRLGVDLNIAAHELGAGVTWTVKREDGEQRSGTLSTTDCPESWRGEIDGAWLTRRRFEVPLDLPPGYHTLEMQIAGSDTARCSVIVSPPECFEPSAIVQGRRLWGVAVQLYTLRSRVNWGIGDFGDLKRMIQWLAPRGAGFIGLNPLHALAPADPARSSPYSASSRHFLNVLYVAVTDIPEFAGCIAAQRRFLDPQFTDRLSVLRALPLVDYRGVADLKMEMLRILFEDFRTNHLAADTARAREFRGFVAGGGALLQSHARFDALDQHLRTTLSTQSGWQNWPEQFRDPAGPASSEFGTANPHKVDFYLYLQWLAHQQLAQAQALTRELGMPIGLYGDYAVGANPGGSESWVDQRSYRMGAEIGAPPDPLALKGQGWGIPPQDPVIMESDHLQGFISLIRNNMRYYGALRLDHVMSLFRLWWVAAGCSPTEGAYVHYPLEKLMSVLALESVRASCLVVGEDLGVVPDEMRHAMPLYGLYHYKVVLFEKPAGHFRRPQDFARRALGTVTTHDMPTLRSYWEGRDIELRRALSLYPSADVQREVEQERERDRVDLLAALKDQQLLPQHPATSSEPFTPELAQALHLYLARSNTTLAALQIEDLLGMIDPVNVPGTDREYPNWQRKLTDDVEDLADRKSLDVSFAEISRARAGD